MLACPLSSVYVCPHSEHELMPCNAVSHCQLVLQMDRECPLVLDVHVAPAKPALQPTSSRERRAQPISSGKGSEKTGNKQYCASHCYTLSLPDSAASIPPTKGTPCAILLGSHMPSSDFAQRDLTCSKQDP